MKDDYSKDRLIDEIDDLDELLFENIRERMFYANVVERQQREAAAVDAAANRPARVDLAEYRRGDDDDGSGVDTEEEFVEEDVEGVVDGHRCDEV